MDEIIFKKMYDEVVDLFPENDGNPHLAYRNKDWIFPNHLDIVIEKSRELAKTYDADEFICALGALLHDTGLTYKREIGSMSYGHEERSVEYTEAFLKKYGLSEDMISRVIGCVRSTEPNHEPSCIEEKIVRTSDAWSQLFSVHFYAKAAFSKDWESYFPWFKKKVTNSFKKICIPEEREKVQGVYEYLMGIIHLYEKNNESLNNQV